MTNRYVLLPDQKDCYFIASSPHSRFVNKPIQEAELVTATVHETAVVSIREVEQFDPYEGNLYKRRVERVYSIPWKTWCSKGIDHKKSEYSSATAFYTREIEYELWTVIVDDLEEFYIKHPFVAEPTDFWYDGAYLMGLMLLNIQDGNGQ